MRPPLRILLAALVLLAGAGALNLRIAEVVRQRPYDVVHVPHGGFARLASLGQRGLVSDAYWLAAVQYVGDPDADKRGFDKLLPLIDLVTDLDPRHGYAYQTAGIVLSAAGRLDESDAILRKGIEKGPNWWSYPYYISFNNWFYRGDFAEGARWAEQAARTPGASPNISHLALSLASKSGSPDDAIAMLVELRRTVKDEVTAGRLDEQLKLAVLERDAQVLERAVAEYVQRTGLPPPADLAILVVSGIVPALPPDPFGGRYVWDRDDQRIHSSANHFRFNKARAPQRPGFQYQTPDVRHPKAAQP